MHLCRNGKRKVSKDTQHHKRDPGSFSVTKTSNSPRLTLFNFGLCRPLVAGTSESDQLDRIFRLLGTPTPQDFPGIVDLPEYTPDLPRYPPPRGGLASLVPTLDPTGVDLANKMLQYDPARRITAQDALDHPFFYDMTRRG